MTHRHLNLSVRARLLLPGVVLFCSIEITANQHIVAMEYNRTIIDIDKWGIKLNMLIADDHYLYAQGIKILLRKHKSTEKFYEAKDLTTVLSQLDKHSIDLLLLDLRMPDMEGFDGVHKIREVYPSLPIVIVTSSESRSDIKAAMDAGVEGYIMKSLDYAAMIDAFDTVIEGNSFFPDINLPLSGPLEPLTRRQLEILSLINDGMGNREISTHLGITEGTVSQHVHAILHTLKVKSRSEAAHILRQYE